MFDYTEIKSLQLEISSYCNAACPQCPRNYFGGKTVSELPLAKWSLEDFKNIIEIDLIKQLEQIYFCGTYGEPLTNTSIVDICKYIKHENPSIKIGIHTNGGIGSKQTYHDLAEYVDFMAFGIDGLSDTNHIYRRHVVWKKVIENATAFIQNNGTAFWDFIVFKHNQHQVDLARDLSKDLGFKKFNVKKTSRFLDRSHQYSDTLDVQDNQGNYAYTISLPTKKEYINKSYSDIDKINNLKDYIANTKINCNAKRIKEVYIGVEGYVFPCGWLHDRMYGPDKNHTDDYQKIKNIFEKIGGEKKANVFYNNLKDIVNGDWFKEIENTWFSNNRIERCSIMCGEKIKLIKFQNEDIEYKD